MQVRFVADSSNNFGAAYSQLEPDMFLILNAVSIWTGLKWINN